MFRSAWAACAAASLAGAALAAPPSGLTPVSTAGVDTLPLLPVPAPATAPRPPARPEAPAGPGRPYDPSLHYLPDYVPSKAKGPAPCGPAGRVWVGAEVLGWAVRGNPLPPLITTSPAGTPVTQAGVLGAPGTAVLFGDDRIDNDLRIGYRITAGGWLDCDHTLGVEASYFQLGDSGTRAAAGFPPGSPSVGIVSRPFFDAAPGLVGPSAELVAFPGVVTGTTSVQSASRLLGGDANLRHNLGCCDEGGYRIDLLYGYRFLNLHEGLTIREDLAVLDTSRGVAAGTRFEVQDQFHTSNQFHGGQIGLAGERRFGALSVDVFGKVAFGSTFREVEIGGATRVTPPGGGPAIVNAGGLLAQATNSGRFSRDDFSVVPEVGLRLGYQLGERVRVFGGYNFLYWTAVARSGEAIDSVVNSTQIPPGALVGPARPLFFDRTSDVWAQGISGGLEVRY
jgi:hypothetical protein